MSTQRLLITGPRGQLGSDLLRAAAAARVPADGLDRAALDLTDTDTIAATLGNHDFDTLVNCAAWTAVDAAEHETHAAFAVNARAVHALARACADRGARLVHISTDYVFDGMADRPYRPEDAPAPLSVYGASKLAGEALARRAHPDGTLVVRTAGLFGVGAPGGAPANFPETMIRLGRERGHLRVVDDVVTAPTHSADLARALLTLLEADAPAGMYHYTSGGEASWYQFARAVLEAAGVDAEVEPVPSAEYATPALRPRYSVLDTSRTTRITGPPPHWREALAAYMEDRP